MHHIGRYQRTRCYWPTLGQVGPPLDVDYRLWRLTPVKGDEWWQSRDGMWHDVARLLRDQRGIVGALGETACWPLYAGMAIASMGAASTPTVVSLNTAYTNNSNGAAAGTRFYNMRARTLTDLYFYINTYTGTAANVNDLEWEVRSGTSAGPTNGGGGLLAGPTAINPSSATGWIAISGLSISLSASTWYYFIIADADGNATDCANLYQRGATWTGTFGSAVLCSSCRTTNGFIGTTRDTSTGKMIGYFSDGSAVGNALTSTETHGADTNQKGAYIPGFTEKITVLGWIYDINEAPTHAYLWEGTHGPSGTPDRSGTAISTIATSTGIPLFLDTPYTCLKSTPYRFVLRDAGAFISPRRGVIGTGVDAKLMATFPWGQYWAESSGTTNWSNDVTTKVACMGFFFGDQVEILETAEVPGVGHTGGILTGGHL